MTGDLHPVPTSPIHTAPDYARTSPLAPAGTQATRNRATLLATCEELGISLGSYDLRILTWLAEWEPQTTVVVASLLRRAYAAGQTAGGAS